MNQKVQILYSLVGRLMIVLTLALLAFFSLQSI